MADERDLQVSAGSLYNVGLGCILSQNYPDRQAETTIAVSNENLTIGNPLDACCCNHCLSFGCLRDFSLNIVSQARSRWPSDLCDTAKTLQTENSSQIEFPTALWISYPSDDSMRLTPTTCGEPTKTAAPPCSRCGSILSRKTSSRRSMTHGLRAGNR